MSDASRRRSGQYAFVPSRAIDDRKITPALLRTLVLLGTYADEHSRCHPSTITMGDRLGISRQAVSRQIRTLQDLGYIHIARVQHDNGGYASNEYVILWNVPLPPERYRKGMQPEVAWMQPDDAGMQPNTVARDATSEVARDATSEVARDATQLGCTNVPIERTHRTYPLNEGAPLEEEKPKTRSRAEPPPPPSPPAPAPAALPAGHIWREVKDRMRPQMSDAQYAWLTACRLVADGGCNFTLQCSSSATRDQLEEIWRNRIEDALAKITKTPHPELEITLRPRQPEKAVTA